MASNPMQRKARNSFLLGMLITAVIAAVIIGLLLYQMSEKQKEEDAELDELVTVYILNQDVMAGATVETMTDNSMVLTTTEINSSLVPDTAITFSNYTQYIADYMSEEDTTYVFKVDLAAGTVLTSDLIVETDELTQDDTRQQEYNVILLPTYLLAGDYVDIRLRMPTGEDYIVISKKKVIDTDEVTIWMNLTEDEILTMSAAIVEAYQISGSLLYATTYVEPGTQESATATYVPSASIIQLIATDPNVASEAQTALYQVYNSLLSERNDTIDPFVAAAEDGQASVASGTSTAIETQQDSRNTYLTELEAAQASTTTTN